MIFEKIKPNNILPFYLKQTKGFVIK